MLIKKRDAITGIPLCENILISPSTSYDLPKLFSHHQSQLYVGRICIIL